MTTKSLAYDHAAYISRQPVAIGQNTAGGSTGLAKFVAFTAMQILSVTAALITAGTSTTTSWNGTATTTSVNGDSFSVVQVSNSAAIGATPVLTTSTHGPYNLSLYNGTATAVQTSVAGAYVNVALSTSTGSIAPVGTGGFIVGQGDQISIVRGADATAVSAFTLEVGILPLSNVTA